MRIKVASVAAVLLLAGCGPSNEPAEEPPESPSASASSTGHPQELDLAAICDALGEARMMPNSDAVEYIVSYNDTQGFGTNAPACGIEPEGEYFDVAAEAGAFGRAEFDYGPYSEEQLETSTTPVFVPGAPEEFLTFDEDSPVGDELPCVDGTCGDIHGHLYDFRFETVMGNVFVSMRFDYITTDIGGERKSEYREQALAAFTAYMEALAAELG